MPLNGTRNNVVYAFTLAILLRCPKYHRHQFSSYLELEPVVQLIDSNADHPLPPNTLLLYFNEAPSARYLTWFTVLGLKKAGII